ncbi:MAG TPA: hypothetical protein PKD23_06720 [Bellilinea sp.]|nr:hypothetical protein [Bellilinea sp.]
MMKIKIIRNTVAKPLGEETGRPVMIGEEIDCDEIQAKELIRLNKAAVVVNEPKKKGSKVETAEGPDGENAEKGKK